jgi:hypothetical protein
MSFDMSSIKLDFELTPELKEILEREAGTLLHPSMKSDTEFDDNDDFVYHPDMKIPEPDDKTGILAWLGVNDEASKRVLKDYDEISTNDSKSLFQEEPLELNLLQNLCDIFLKGIPRRWNIDNAEGFGK